MIADMLEVNQILEHRMTASIMTKKYPKLFDSLDKSQGVLYKEYARYLSACRFELDELELEEKVYDVARMYAQGGEENAQVFQIFKYVNQIVYEKVILLEGSVPEEVSKIVEYAMEQGMQYEVIRRREAELKAKMPATKVTEDSVLDEGYLGTFKRIFAEE
jgi:hypothetical protein